MSEEGVVVYNCCCALSENELNDVKDELNAIDGIKEVLDGYDLCSDVGQRDLIKEINEKNIKNLIILCSASTMPELTFNHVVRETGVSPVPLIIHEKETLPARLREMVSNPPEPKKIEKVVPAALVIGGGIAGIQASLDIADAGFKTYVVEREPSIGGRMSQLDKTFPTLDCSACILTPKMVDVPRNENIELITYAEVTKIEGEAGDFHVTVVKKPRYVDEDKCTGCGVCGNVCPVYFKSEFNMELGVRKAAFVPFPQAVPLKYTLTRDACMRCGLCKIACEAGAIDYDQKEKVYELNVGAIVVATGYDQFDAREKPEYGYGTDNRIITGLEFERMVSPSGPTGGKVLIDGKPPTKVVFIQCVGSRDKNHNPYCSRVCCMYAAKQAHLVREKAHDSEVTICYMDVRAFGKGYEEFYERVQRERVLYVRGNPSEIYRRGDMLIVRGEDTLTGEAYEREADLVVLATGIVPRVDSKAVADLLGIEVDENGFFVEADPQHSIETSREGVFLAGCCQSPKDIPDTVGQASGAAAKATILLSKFRRVKEEVIA